MPDTPPDTPRKARSRIALLSILAVVIALGLASRKYANSLPDFFAENAGDSFWTVAVYLSLAILAPGCPPLKLGLLAFGISISVELSQLLDFGWLDALRKTLAGRLLLGSGFLWVDLVRYFAGAVIACAADSLWRHRYRDGAR